MREFIDKAKDTIKNAEDQLAEGAKKAVAGVDKLKEKARDALADVEDEVKEGYEKVRDDLKK